MYTWIMDMSHSLNSLKGGYVRIQGVIGEYCTGGD